MAGRIVPLDTKMMKSLQETRGKARYNSSFWLVKVLDIHHCDYVIATNDISTNLLRSFCRIRLATPQVAKVVADGAVGSKYHLLRMEGRTGIIYPHRRCRLQCIFKMQYTHSLSKMKRSSGKYNTTHGPKTQGISETYMGITFTIALLR